MASPGEEFPEKIRSAAQDRVGDDAVQGGKDKGGIDCFALVDDLLKSAEGKRPSDFGKVTPTSDYVWGDAVELDKVKPGDILQFRDHIVKIRNQKLGEFDWKDTGTEGPFRRPHHTAVVVEVEKDGSVTVVEQNVKPHPKKVTRNVIARLAAGEETRLRSTVLRDVITVTGSVKAYRPVRKTEKAKPERPEKGKSEKGTMLFLFPLHQESHIDQRTLAQYSPREGGAKRRPGPLGNA